MWRVCVCKYAAPWDTPRATSHQPPQRRIRPSAHLSHQSHLEEQHGGALHPSVWSTFHSACSTQAAEPLCVSPAVLAAIPEEIFSSNQPEDTKRQWGVTVQWIYSNLNNLTHSVIQMTCCWGFWGFNDHKAKLDERLWLTQIKEFISAEFVVWMRSSWCSETIRKRI